MEHWPAVTTFNSPVRVILRRDTNEEAWNKQALEHFASAYAPEDDIYEKLIDESPGR